MVNILSELMDAIKTNLKVPAVVMPQKAIGNTARVELYFSGIKPLENGAGREKQNAMWQISFTAVLKSNGTHEKWVEKTVLCSMVLSKFEASHMPIGNVGLSAYWKRNGGGSMEYTSEESGMPDVYSEPWTVTVDVPARLINTEE